MVFLYLIYDRFLGFGAVTWLAKSNMDNFHVALLIQ